MPRTELVVALGLAFSACTATIGGSNPGGGGGGGSDGGMSCLDSCTAGTFTCQGIGLSTCSVGADGCLAWSTPVPCPATQTCSLGFCADHDTWSSSTGMPRARAQFGLAATANSLYVAGGMAGIGSLAAVDVYAIATNTWTSVASLPTPTASPVSLAGPDGRIYTIGGHYPAGDTATCVTNGPVTTCTYAPAYTASIAYSPAANSWTRIAEIPTQRLYMAGATGPDGLLYIMGGATGSSLITTSSVEAYNTTTGSWQTIANMPTPRARLAAVTGPDGKIYALGGMTGSAPNSDTTETALTTAERYNPATKAWEAVAAMTTPRINFAAAVGIDGRIYVFGGETGMFKAGEKQLASVEAYTPATNTWAPVASLPANTINHGAAAGNSPQLVVIGGQTQEFDGMERSSVVSYTP